jgi:predicted dehydrogenase
MAPMRVGIVGLSSHAVGSSWAKMTHLPYLRRSPEYDISGVVNSSLASSKAAIQEFGLSSTAAPYADIDSMASDPNIDLIVVCVEVKLHAKFVKAAIEHGKKVYCEWPLGRHFEEANELATLAAERGVQTYVGLESRLSPVTTTLRQLISSDIIGKITSTDAIGCLGPPPKIWSEGSMFYLDVHSGQSPLHTRVGHFLDAFCFTVGEFQHFQPLLATHQTEVNVYDVPVSQLAEVVKNPGTPFRTVKRTSPDEILLQGQLIDGAVANIHLRSGANDADGNMLRWLITGTAGVIEVTQKTGQFLRDKSVKIELVKDGKITVVDLDWDTDEEFGMFGDHVVLTTPGRNYKAIAENLEWAIIDFQHAATRHKMLDRIIKVGLARH